MTTTSISIKTTTVAKIPTTVIDPAKYWGAATTAEVQQPSQFTSAKTSESHKTRRPDVTTASIGQTSSFSTTEPTVAYVSTGGHLQLQSSSNPTTESYLAKTSNSPTISQVMTGIEPSYISTTPLTTSMPKRPRETKTGPHDLKLGANNSTIAASEDEQLLQTTEMCSHVHTASVVLTVDESTTGPLLSTEQTGSLSVGDDDSSTTTLVSAERPVTVATDESSKTTLASAEQTVKGVTDESLTISAEQPVGVATDESSATSPTIQTSTLLSDEDTDHTISDVDRNGVSVKETAWPVRIATTTLRTTTVARTNLMEELDDLEVGETSPHIPIPKSRW